MTDVRIEIENKNNTMKKKFNKHKHLKSSLSIPLFNDYKFFITNTYTVAELKHICRYYQLKVTGLKSVLITRIYNYLKKSASVIKIQSLCRKYLVKKYIHCHGPSLFKRELCVNESDFLTLDSLKDIPHYQFYSFKDDDHFIYGFDITSLYNLIQIHGKNACNPYNRSKLPLNIIQTIRKQIRLCRLFHYPLELQIDDCNKFKNPSQILDTNIHELFQKIDELGFYTKSDWFIKLDRSKLILFLKNLYDIWNYRAQISETTKLQIVYNTGNPFLGYDLRNINHKTFMQIKKISFTIMHKLITSGIDNPSKWLGASYCLTALTIVSNDAANAIPWLYQPPH